jgi:hypothetical protein
LYFLLLSTLANHHFLFAQAFSERAKTKATQQGYHKKHWAHTAWMKHTLILDKMLEEKKILLKKKNWDLKVWEAALVEAQACSIHPQENRDLLPKLVELRECLTRVEVDCVTKAEELAALVTGISMVLMELDWLPFGRFPRP